MARNLKIFHFFLCKDPEMDGMNLWPAISTGGTSPRTELILNLDDMMIPAEGHEGIR